MQSNCPFCEEIFHKDKNLYENNLAWVKESLGPVSDGHMLVIPKRHIADFFDSTKEEKVAIMELLDWAKAYVESKFKPDGYNIGVNCGQAAGQTVMHLHIHLIPRYKGDVEDPRGGVRGVIPSKIAYW
ncbi:MAG: HIT family protein [Firmicutes bacterium]|nr:HIT family protein [Bacillota bacterium]